MATQEGSPDPGAGEQWEGSNQWRRPFAARDSEEQWQDDLTKWKNRRRSTKSDRRTRSQDREHVIKQMINGAPAGLEQKTNREQQSTQRGDSATCSSCPLSKTLSLELQRTTRAPLARGFATDEPFSPSTPLRIQNSAKTLVSGGQTVPATEGGVLGVERHSASMASTNLPPAQIRSSLTLTSSEATKVETKLVTQISTLVTTLKPSETTKSTGVNHVTVSLCKTRPGGAALKGQTSCPEPVCRPDGGAVPDFGTPQEAVEEPDGGQQVAGPHRFLSKGGSWSRSASLPRGFRRSEGSSRLSSAITARPFGAMQPRVSSLPKLCNVDDKQGLLPKSQEDGSLFAPFKSSLRRQTATAQLMAPVQAPADDGGGREQQDEVRDAAFLQDCQEKRNGSLEVPTELGLDSQKAGGLQQIWSKVDHSDMRVSLALKPNSRPDFGFQTRWDSTGLRVSSIQPGSPAELCRLRVDDEIVAVNGLPVAHMSRPQWTEKMTSSLQMGSVTMDIRRYGSKDWSRSGEGGLHSLSGQSRMTLNLTSASPVLISRQTDGGASALGRASGLNGQTDQVRDVLVEAANSLRTAKSRGGSESAISNLQVPSLSSSSPNWSWDLEEDRRRQEKWQEEQERLLQAQYQRDQERLEAEWRRAQRDAAGESRAEAEMINGHMDKQLKANGSSGTSEASSLHAVQLRPAGRKSLPSRAANGLGSQESWPDDCGGLVQLSPAHRSKSASTPLLAGAHKQNKGVAEEEEEERKKRKGQSKVEVDRQKILEEMKKRTQLLTDNSWIRQRSSSSSVAHKEPLYLGVALKRFESLDDLDSLRQPSPSSSAALQRPHSAAAGYYAPSRNTPSRYSTGGMLPRRLATVDCSHHGRTLTGRRTCCACDRVVASGAAMLIEALSLCFHLACFQCVGCCRHLGQFKVGVQVRVRNRKPYCERCYFRLKSCGGFSVTDVPRLVMAE